MPDQDHDVHGQPQAGQPEDRHGTRRRDFLRYTGGAAAAGGLAGMLSPGVAGAGHHARRRQPGRRHPVGRVRGRQRDAWPRPRSGRRPRRWPCATRT